MYLLRLGEIGEDQEHLVGGKALRLSRVMAAGLPVPPGVVVTTAACPPGGNGSAPPGLWEELEGSGILQWPLAVRSSAIAEDTKAASFAGIYRSHLAVSGHQQVAAALADCWSALDSPKAASYRRQMGIAATDRMAVILQKMVPAESAGVLFTLNPLTGREEECLIESTRGLGDAVLSGTLTPDSYVVNPWEGRVCSRKPGTRPAAADAGDGAPEALAASADPSMSLTDPQAVALALLGRRVQEIFGRPQEVEWALAGGLFYVLQARPVTALSFAPDMGLWTAANFREVMPGTASMLSQSQSFHHDFSRAMEEIYHRLRLWRAEDKGTVWSRSFFGHGYWNAGATKRVVSRLPGFRERTFDRTVGIEPSYEGDGRVTPFTPATVMRALPTLLALKKQYREVLREAGEFTASFQAEEERWDGINPRDLDDRDLRATVVAALDFHWRTNRHALLVSFLATQAQEDFQSLLDGLAVPGVSMARLLVGLSGVATATPAVRLHEISREARREGVAPGDIPGALEDETSYPQTSRAWRRFLLEFRHMSDIDEDLAQPRWDENPSAPAAMLRGYMGAGDDEGPEARLRRQLELRSSAERRVLERLAGRPQRRRSFEAQYSLVKKYCWWREETRVYLSRARYQTRRFLLELDSRWLELGLIEAPGDVFWMERDSLLGLLSGTGDPAKAREQVRRHRRTAVLYRKFTPPLIIGPAAVAETRGGLGGVGCSPGIGEGPARILRDLGDAHTLRRGDVLVAPHANPAWTPLFSLAAAVVLEEGGLLSHCAVVAREMGVPVVVQVGGATDLIPPGCPLRVDGHRGTVERLDGKDAGRV